MDGRWLALGTIGALAVAGARRRGSGARKRYWISRLVTGRGRDKLDLDDFPVFVNYSTRSGYRSSWAMPSRETAEAWAEHLKGRSYVRVTTDNEPSRSSEGVSGVRFLLPSGDLASDLTLQRTLAGLILSSRWGRFRISADRLDPEDQRRLQTIELRRRHWTPRRGYMSAGHRTALREMMEPLCNPDLDANSARDDWGDGLTELAWLINHPYEGY